MQRANSRWRNSRGATLSLFSTKRMLPWQRLAVLLCLSMFLQVMQFPSLRAPSSPSSHGGGSPSALLWIVSAMPTGAASCVGGKAAVDGYHLDTSNGRPLLTGELAQGGVKVMIDNSLTLLPTIPTRLKTGADHEITVETSDPRGFKGILLRLEDAATSNKRDMSYVLFPNFDDLDLQMATVCEAPIAGLTHTNSTSKTMVTASLRFAFPGTVYLDLTIVGVNNATASLYGYNRYEITVEGEPDTSAPTLPPGKTSAPTLSPAPTVAPTMPDVQGTLSPTFDGRRVSAAASSTYSSSTTFLAVAATMTAIPGVLIHWLL